ncbi:MAG TPA: c-type cytochrome [Candidatus Kapabacteria bacterium]|jgi:mono/diheme cytochrome c family protein|nr:c-type cytochrome [Candidatus Kapabacteria bacterium]
MNGFWKWTRRIAGGLVLLLVLIVGTTYGLSEVNLQTTYEIPETRVSIPTDAMSIERGRHLAVAIGKCIDCHGEDFGGKIVIDDAAVGLLAGPNLTSGAGGLAPTLHDSDWVRAIRHGIKHDGRPIALMPSEDYWHYDDEEVAAVVAYIKSVPPVNRTMPEVSVGPVIRLMNVLGQVEFAAQKIDHEADRPATPPEAPTAEYGAHVVKTGGCIGCHGPSLSGGPIPGAPPHFKAPRNITPHESGLAGWSEEDFFRALRTGVTPTGDHLDPTYMPWNATKLMKDLEIKALWAYLKTVPPKPEGNR